MLIQLFILGILSENNYHPYFIKKLFTNIVDIDPSFKLSDGKLYYHFDSLEKKGYIKKIEVIHTENRPEKSVYAITDAGRAYMVELIYKTFNLINLADVQSLYIPILFLKYVDLKRVIGLLDQAIERESKRIDSIIEAGSHPSVKDVDHIQLIIRHADRQFNENLKWLQDIRDAIAEHI